MFKARSAILLATVATTLIAVSCALAQDHWQDPAVGSVRLTQSGPIAQGLEVNRKVLEAIGVDRALLAFRWSTGDREQGVQAVYGIDQGSQLGRRRCKFKGQWQVDCWPGSREQIGPGRILLDRSAMAGSRPDRV